MYPEIIPNKIGIIFKKPRMVTQNIMVINKVSNETIAEAGSIVQSAPASAGAIQPAIADAEGKNSSPMTEMRASIAAVDKIMSIQDAEKDEAFIQTTPNTIPTIINSLCTYPSPSIPL